jgi:hypothetical protein
LSPSARCAEEAADFAGLLAWRWRNPLPSHSATEGRCSGLRAYVFQCESRRLLQVRSRRSAPPYSRAAATACACELRTSHRSVFPSAKSAVNRRGAGPLLVAKSRQSRGLRLTWKAPQPGEPATSPVKARSLEVGHWRRVQRKAVPERRFRATPADRPPPACRRASNGRAA